MEEEEDGEELIGDGMERYIFAGVFCRKCSVPDGPALDAGEVNLMTVL